MGSQPQICQTIASCVYDFQTLISGALAILAAVASAIVIWRAAKLPIEEQKRQARDLIQRRLLFATSVLSKEFQTLSSRARQAEGTIKVTIAANANVNDDTREKTTLKLHPMLDDWELMSTLTKGRLDEIAEFRHLVSDHNFDMQRAGGAFGADNFRQSILARIGKIEGTAMHISNQLSAVAQIASREITEKKLSWLNRLRRTKKKPLATTPFARPDAK